MEVQNAFHVHKDALTVSVLLFVHLVNLDLISLQVLVEELALIRHLLRMENVTLVPLNVKLVEVYKFVKNVEIHLYY